MAKRKRYMTEAMEHILAVPLPGLVRADMRQHPRKERAAAIRALFKRLGIKGVSVTAPNYAHAKTVNVDIKRLEDQPTQRVGNASVPHKKCREAEIDVARKLEAIILSAFPDLDDRSDPQSDYYDYCISIHMTR